MACAQFLANSPEQRYPTALFSTDRRQIAAFPSTLVASVAFLLCAAAGSSAQTSPAAPNSQPSAATQTTASEKSQSQAPADMQTAPPIVSGGEITEDRLRQQLVGKPLYIRGGYLGESLSFNEHGEPTGHPSRGSFTLSAVTFDEVRLTKHKVELEGARYALHYVAGSAETSASGDVDRLRITPKKKTLKITLDREQVVKAKVAKEKRTRKDAGTRPKAASVNAPVTQAANGEPGASTVTPVGSASKDTPIDKAPDNPAEQAAEQAPALPNEKDSDQAADPQTVTTTTSSAHASAIMAQALNHVFAADIDERFQGQLPEFWQLYFRAQKAGAEYRPTDAAVLMSNAVDQQAKVISSIAPESNEIAQANGISGRALYRAVIGADGSPSEIAVVRPIGVGLDENAVEAIRKAKFQPAMKGGQPVAETLDLAVMFRIYSKRTAVTQRDVQTPPPADAPKPGPYSVKPQ